MGKTPSLSLRALKCCLLCLVSQVLSKKCSNVPSILGITEQKLLKCLMKAHFAGKLDPYIFHFPLFATLEYKLYQNEEGLHALCIRYNSKLVDERLDQLV